MQGKSQASPEFKERSAELVEPWGRSIVQRSRALGQSLTVQPTQNPRAISIRPLPPVATLEHPYHESG